MSASVLAFTLLKCSSACCSEERIVLCRISFSVGFEISSYSLSSEYRDKLVLLPVLSLLLLLLLLIDEEVESGFFADCCCCC